MWTSSANVPWVAGFASAWILALRASYSYLELKLGTGMLQGTAQSISTMQTEGTVPSSPVHTWKVEYGKIHA